jgi:hypothetical protein
MGPPYTSLINEIERRLKGIKIDEKLLREKVQEAYNLPGRYIENCTVDEMAKAIMGACGKPAQDIADAYRRTI